MILLTQAEGEKVLILNFVTMLFMNIGLLLTLTPRLPGTLIIAGSAFFYGVFTEFRTFGLWITQILLMLVVIAEIGGRVLRRLLTKHCLVSPVYSTDTTAGNFAGILASDAIFGPVIGTAMWELIVGKTLFPRWNSILKVLMRLAVSAALRFICGVIMIILISKYILV